MKKLVSLLVVTLFIGFIYAQTESVKIRVGVLNGPSAVPAARLMKNYKTAEFTKFADPQALLPKLIKKEIDVGFLPVNVAAKVYNSTNGAIICGGITGYGNLSVISKENINRFSDLEGKTVFVAGQGATPEYMLRYLLEQNGITSGKNVTLEYSIPTAQLAASIIADKISYAVVPEPFSTIAISKSKEVKKVLDLQDEYKAFNPKAENYPLTVMVVTKSFAEKNSDLLDDFISNYKNSVQWTVANPKAAGQLFEELDLGLASGIVTRAIPYSNYDFTPADEAQAEVEKLLNIFLQYSKESIGEKLPARDFYYAKKNP